MCNQKQNTQGGLDMKDDILIAATFNKIHALGLSTDSGTM